MDFLTVLGERVVSFFVRTVDDFDGTFFGPVGFVVRDANAVNIFEMVLDGLGFNRRIRADMGEDFYRNKLFVDVAVSRVIDSRQE